MPAKLQVWYLGDTGSRQAEVTALSLHYRVSLVFMCLLEHDDSHFPPFLSELLSSSFSLLTCHWSV